MHDTCIPKQCYFMLKRLDQEHRENWVTSIKNLLFRYGFGYVQIAQEVGDKTIFLCNWWQRLKDCALQEWSENVQTSDKLNNYCQYKSLLNIERYLTVVKSGNHRQALSGLRCSSHPLQIEAGRKLKIPRHERFCVYCLTQGEKSIEDEYHFVMKCMLYSELRENTVHQITKSVSNEAFIHVMSTKREHSLKMLAKFIYLSRQKRTTFLANISN